MLRTHFVQIKLHPIVSEPFLSPFKTHFVQIKRLITVIPIYTHFVQIKLGCVAFTHLNRIFKTHYVQIKHKLLLQVYNLMFTLKPTMFK